MAKGKQGEVYKLDSIPETFDRLESKVQSYARNFPALFEKASGAEIWGKSGKRYIDFLSAAGSLNYGHNHPDLKAALMDFISSDHIGNSLDLHTVAKQEFLLALEEIIFKPRGLDYVVQFCGPTGTNAVEAAMKLARKCKGRSNIVAFTNGFHGMTSGALAATANSGHRNGAGLPLQGVSRMPYEGYLGAKTDTLELFEKMLADPSSGLDHPAAVLVETVQGEGGHHAASVSWLRRLEKLCRANDMLLIVDEIQTGCGRTGTFFSFEEAGLKPDIVTLSKSISGLGLPLALVLFNRELDIWEPGEHNGTFRGNNFAFVTATAALKLFWADADFEARIAENSKLLENHLTAIQQTHEDEIVELRGRGMMRGLCFANPDKAARIAAECFHAGLIIERVGPKDEVIKCMAPVTISTDILKEGLDILRHHTNAVLGKPCASSRRSKAHLNRYA